MTRYKTKTQRNWGRKQQAFKAALRWCNTVAREEYPVAQKALDRARDLVLNLQNRMETIKIGAANRQGTATREAQRKLAELAQQLDKVITDELATAFDSLSEKRNSLERFTVTLFGRTMTGKSTIREAIMQGDGSTIGKGGQRTTRDIQEYEWNDLRIIDTPGIGSYKGEADAVIARSVIDESDVLLFLTHSDGIQESSFRGMQNLRDEKKPIIFVLNVKRDLATGQVKMKKFLQSPESIMGKEVIGGHINRIRRLAEEKLGMRRVNIVPIHAQAAFLATRPEYKQRSKELHEASGIDELLDALMNEVRQRGPVRRLQTLLDGTIIKLTDIEGWLQKEAQSLDRSAKQFRDKFVELNTWFDGYIGNIDRRIGHYTSEVLRPLRNSVSAFIDENIEREDVEARWNRHMESMKIVEKMGDFQKQLHDEVRERLEEFNRETTAEWELMEAITVQGPEQYNPHDTKRTLKRIGTGSGLLVGVAVVAAKIGAANFWNPVGLIAGGVIVLAGIASLFFGNREKKLQQKKNETTNQLRAQIDSMEQHIVNETKKWFSENITSGLVWGIQQEISQLYDGMFQISHALKEAASALGKNIKALNRRLLTRRNALVGEKLADREVGKALGEEVDKVEQDRRYDKTGEGVTRPASEPVPKSASDIELIRRACTEQLLSRKAQDIVVIDLHNTADFVDYVLICTGTSDMHVRALADAVIQRLKAQGQPPYHVEGYDTRKWVLIDFVDIIVHIFQAESRQFYGLERLWGDAPIEHIEDRVLTEQGSPSNVNSLVDLLGIRPEVARSIKAYHTRNGPFQQLDELKQINRIILNLAPTNLLMDWFGIRPDVAKNIVAYREQHGPFQQLDDLKRVRGAYSLFCRFLMDQ